jgi:diadenosine tetraphosphate (Ap4A) HIT family hydrolase
VEEYLGLQRLVYRLTEAVRTEVGAERMYILTFGSNQGNPHVHWHVVPLPPGALRGAAGHVDQLEQGMFEITRGEIASLAARIAERLG